MEENIIRDEVEKAENSFGVKSNKFSGALMIEVLKSHLERNGFSLSNRNVFIKGVKSEIDLMVVLKNAKPQHDIIYEPTDVIAAFEVKRSGSYGERDVHKIRNIFDNIIDKNPQIFCCYITLKERKNYKYKITSGNLSYQVYTLFFYEKDGEALKNNEGEWDNFLEKLKTVSPV